ncbi:hypothetical protein [Burkholderia sp. Ac-20353]|uniref:hypothetical protein n=1 Tax=Burkholderia sp. Ac-20353 TaxID=2703894 RepID=UPI001F11A228|nr:hypothetical protein [Burkholderia sp. Ac-20353]
MIHTPARTICRPASVDASQSVSISDIPIKYRSGNTASATAPKSGTPQRTRVNSAKPCNSVDTSSDSIDAPSNAARMLAGIDSITFINCSVSVKASNQRMPLSRATSVVAMASSFGISRYLLHSGAVRERRQDGRAILMSNLSNREVRWPAAQAAACASVG